MTIKCTNCSSSGFLPSIIEDQCEFCDGSVGGQPPEPEKDKAQMVATMCGPNLYPYQREILNRLMEMEMDLSTIKERVMYNCCQDDIMDSIIHTPSHQTYESTITGKLPDPTIWIVDEAHSSLPWYVKDWDIEPDNRDEKDWERTMFKKDTLSSTPSADKRAKLRAKRKKRK